MEHYEIRILRQNEQPLIFASRFLGDFHAIRRGQAMAQDDEGVEVWRGMKCLYRREVLPKDFGRPPNAPRTPPPADGRARRGTGLRAE